MLKYKVVPLTKELAQATGHMSWVESRDPEEAYGSMVEAVRLAPFNVSVWANAGEQLSQDQLRRIQDWRRFPRSQIDNVHSWNPHAKYNIKPRLDDVFNKVVQGHPGSALLANHVFTQAQLILKHAQPDRLDIETRAWQGTMKGPRQEQTIDPASISEEAHADGSDLRFLQSLDCPGTLLVENKNAVHTPDGVSKYAIRDDAEEEIVLYEPPENSILLMVGDTWPHQPILHLSALTPEGAQPIKRTVQIYTLHFYDESRLG